MAKLTGLAAKVVADQYKRVLENKGFAFFENGDHNLNIIGVRNDSGDASKFDDFINVLYKEAGEWVCDTYPVTTEPGTSILRHPLKSVAHKGTAILVPGQYRSTYKIGWHGNRDRGHMALCQRGGKVSVWRDNNRDRKADIDGPREKGMFGINIHRQWGSDDREYTGGVSAGCQVFRSSKDFYEFMEICHVAAEMYSNSFTYTLINDVDLDNTLDMCV